MIIHIYVNEDSVMCVEWRGEPSLFVVAFIRDNPGQQLYHARAEQLGELGLPGCDEALSGMGGASLTNEVPGVM